MRLGNGGFDALDVGVEDGLSAGKGFGGLGLEDFEGGEVFHRRRRADCCGRHCDGGFVVLLFGKSEGWKKFRAASRLPA